MIRALADPIQRKLLLALGAVRFDEWISRVSTPSCGFVDLATLPWASNLAASWPQIRQEFDALSAAGVRLPSTTEVAGYDQGVGDGWTSYLLHWYGKPIEETCARMPVTAEFLLTVPGLQVAGLSRLAPHTAIPPHQGPTQCVRVHLGVTVPDPPGSSTLTVGHDRFCWIERTVVAFDDRCEHQAANCSSDYRTVLVIQVEWPTPRWQRWFSRWAHRRWGRATASVPERVGRLDDILNYRDR